MVCEIYFDVMVVWGVFEEVVKIVEKKMIDINCVWDMINGKVV